MGGASMGSRSALAAAGRTCRSFGQFPPAADGREAPGLVFIGNKGEILYDQDHLHLLLSLAMTMIYEFTFREDLHKAWSADPGLCGPSPGGASGALGISRQAVYAAVKRGSLDMVRLVVPDETRRGPCLYITRASIERYRKNQGRPGPRPGFRQRALLAKDKFVAGVWPALQKD